MLLSTTPLSLIAFVLAGLLILRTLLSLRALLYHLYTWWRWIGDRAHAYQTFTIPRFTPGNPQENALYRKTILYLSSLPSLEDSDAAALISTGKRPNDLSLLPDPGHPVSDSFLGARLSWTTHPDHLSLRLRRHDRRRVLRPYLQHLEAVADDIDLRRREVRLFTSSASSSSSSSSWTSVPFLHPATIETVAMDPDLKARLRLDLENYLKGRSYYHRLGRVWRRSYLLHGPPGTGKSSFVAAMAKFLCYDIYDVDLSHIADATDLRSLLLQTNPRSIILIEDLDRYLSGGDNRLTGMLNFMDGIFSCCGEERVMVFTMNEDRGVDPAVLRPGRMDVHVPFPMCDFSAFKTLASSYLGLKDHKLYPQVEEGFQSGAVLSPAVIGEIMIANRGSPSRALKSVISALQRSSSTNNGGRIMAGSGGSRRGDDSGPLSEVVSVEGCGHGVGLGFGKDATMREFRKLYGMIRIRGGSKKESSPPSLAEAAAAAAMNGGGEMDR